MSRSDTDPHATATFDVEALRIERAELAAALHDMDAASAAGTRHPVGYRAEYYRQQVSELDDLIRALTAPDAGRPT